MNRPTTHTRHLQLLPSGSTAVQAAASDEDVLLSLERRDGTFGEALYCRVKATLHSTLNRVMGGSEEEHDEAMVLAFKQVVRTLTLSRFTRACSLNSWARCIAVRVALKSMRAGARSSARGTLLHSTPEGQDTFGAVPLNDIRASALSSGADVSARLELSRLRQHLAHMPTGLAETLVLHDALGHEPAELAVLLSRSLSRLEGELRRGRAFLRERCGSSKDAGTCHPGIGEMRKQVTAARDDSAEFRALLVSLINRSARLAQKSKSTRETRRKIALGLALLSVLSIASYLVARGVNPATKLEATRSEVVHLDSGIKVWALPGSSYQQAPEDSTHHSYRLSRGELRFRVALSDQGFTLNTPSESITTQSAEFRVTVAGEPTRRSSISVTEGRLRIQSGTQLLELRAGQTWQGAPTP